ncbi:integrase, partial [Klebsiella pneumoniae]|nr:integrase [Klebsiella pneumoniae]MDX4961697.1 integrase [Klebsiella pneumoniae]
MVFVGSISRYHHHSIRGLLHMALNELSPKKIENAKPKDADYKLTDGGSLYLL